MVFVPEMPKKHCQSTLVLCVCLPLKLEREVFMCVSLCPLLMQEYLGWMSMAIDLLSLVKVMNKKWICKID